MDVIFSVYASVAVFVTNVAIGSSQKHPRRGSAGIWLHCEGEVNYLASNTGNPMSAGRHEINFNIVEDAPDSKWKVLPDRYIGEWDGGFLMWPGHVTTQIDRFSGAWNLAVSSGFKSPYTGQNMDEFVTGSCTSETNPKL